ncbi:MAG TPA: hypothetical protein VFZ53_01895, partial [Polyangiaceae bacterium]
MVRWRTSASLLGLWIVGCSFFEFPAPERAPEGSGGSTSSGGKTSGGASGVSGTAGMTGGDGSGGAGG